MQSSPPGWLSVIRFCTQEDLPLIRLTDRSRWVLDFVSPCGNGLPCRCPISDSVKVERKKMIKQEAGKSNGDFQGRDKINNRGAGNEIPPTKAL